MKRTIYMLGLVAVAMLAGVIMWGFNSTKASGPPNLDIVINAENMNFNQNNPPIEVKKGQTVRLTVKNSDQPGVYHDFAIPALGVKTSLLKPGEVEILTFTANHDGIFTYTCPFHPKMMTGKVIIR